MPTITDSLIRRSRPREVKYELSCARLRGFVLRVLPSGKKVFYVRYRRDGKDRRERLGLVSEMTLAAARRRASDILRDATRPAPAMTSGSPTPAAPTLREFARRFDREHIEPYLKPRTRRTYRDCLRLYLLPALGELSMASITKAQVSAVHRAHREIPSAANQAIRVLSVMYGRAIEWGALPADATNPALRLRKFRENRRERFLSPAERRRLEGVLRDGLETPAGRKGAIRWANVAAIRLLAWTGMRRQEVLDLTWDMVDYRHHCLRLPESKTGRKVVPVSNQVVTLLKRLEARRRPARPWVLYSQAGGKVHHNCLEHAWRLIRARAGLTDVRLHDLRHSAASDALMSGVPLAIVGKLLGHKSPRTTARYAHIADHVLAEAAARMGDAIARAQGEAE